MRFKHTIQLELYLNAPDKFTAQLKSQEKMKDLFKNLKRGEIVKVKKDKLEQLLF